MMPPETQSDNDGTPESTPYVDPAGSVVDGSGADAAGIHMSLLKHTLQGGGVGIWEADVIGLRMSIDAQDAELLGLDSGAQTLSMNDFLELVHPDDRDGVLASYERARQQMGPYEHECRFIRPDGHWRWLAGRGIFIRDRDGKVVRLAGIHVDVTEQRRAERQLRENQRRLATLMSNLPGMVCRYRHDRQWTMLFVSEGVQKITGHTVEEMLSGDLHWRDVICPDDRQWLWDEVQQAIDARRPFEVEYRIVHADGQMRWVWEQGRGLFDDDELVTLEGFVCDITSRKRAEKHLREADRRKDRFLAILGHELRNPLTAISSSADLLGALEPEDPKVRRVHEVLVRQSRHMRRLVDGLLDVSRIAQGKVDIRKKTVDLRGVVQGLLEDRAPRLASRSVDLSLPPKDHPIYVKADPTRLAQVLDNLVTNAVEATNAADTIEVTVDADAQHAVVTVADTGEGIPESVLSQIFEPFEQARTEPDGSGGLGLGLALVKGLVDLHDGHIEAHSPGRGAGARFEVTLPLTEPPEPDSDSHVQWGDHSPQILVVEDDPDIAEVFELLLSRAGMEVTVAPTASAGLAEATRRRPDVVVCDLNLSDASGCEFAETIRAHDRLADLPLVALTGYASQSVRKRAMQAGFDEHLTKPVTMDELASVCARVQTERTSSPSGR